MIRQRNTNPSVDMFKRMPLFEGCGEHELELLGLVADEVLLRNRFELVRQGEIGRDFFILLNGEAQVRVAGQVVGTARPGTVIGAQSLLDHTPRTASVVTTGPARVFSFDRRGLSQLMSCPRVALRVVSARSDVPECLPPELFEPVPLRQLCAPLLASAPAAH